jgi:hypothetical protein
MEEALYLFWASVAIDLMYLEGKESDKQKAQQESVREKYLSRTAVHICSLTLPYI